MLQLIEHWTYLMRGNREANEGDTIDPLNITMIDFDIILQR